MDLFPLSSAAWLFYTGEDEGCVYKKVFWGEFRPDGAVQRNGEEDKKNWAALYNKMMSPINQAIEAARKRISALSIPGVAAVDIQKRATV